MPATNCAKYFYFFLLLSIIAFSISLGKKNRGMSQVVVEDGTKQEAFGLM